jgi:hypothetical protein
MSRKTKKWQRINTDRRREQTALQNDLTATELSNTTTIGDMYNRMVTQKAAMSPAPLSILSKQASLPTTTPATPTAPITPPKVSPVHWPACPASCDPAEWQRAMENHDHYIQCAEKDNNVKPWFQYPRYTHQYSEFVYITPDMAKLLLEFNPLNRKIKMAHVDGLKRDIQNNRWLQTHESIAINKLGNMHDGQHRAVGVIKADKGWPFYVTWNVPPEAIYATDSGDKRPINEKLAFLFPDLKMTHKTAALCRSMMWGLSNRGIRYTESEIANFMFKHQRIVDWTMRSMRAYRSDLQAVIAKSMLWWGEAIIGPFVERLHTVQFVGDGDPAKALFLWLQNSKQAGKRTGHMGPILYYKKTLAAIQAHAAQRETKRITAKEQDVFEWLPGWEVPGTAPSAGKVFIHEPSTEAVSAETDDEAVD